LHTGDDYREIGAGAFLRFALKSGDDLPRERDIMIPGNDRRK